MNTTYKFGSSDIIKFLKIYRKYECLWDTENASYKNRYVRNAALAAFADEFGVEGFGPREITSKIKNLRTQYQAEKKKVKNSIGSGSDTEYVYKPTLVFFDLMDSFLGKNSDTRETISDLANSNDDSLQEHENNSILFVEKFEDSTEEDKLKTFKRKSVSSNCMSPSNNQEDTEKRARIDKYDDIDSFGKYVITTLRKLNDKNCIHAQDEIQAVLSKYKLKDIKESEQ